MTGTKLCKRWLRFQTLLRAVACTSMLYMPLLAAATSENFNWNTETHQLLEADFNQDGYPDLILQAKTPAHQHYLLTGTAAGNRRYDFTKRLELPEKIAGMRWTADAMQLLAFPRPDQQGAALLAIASNGSKALLFSQLHTAADLAVASHSYAFKQNKWLQDSDAPRYFSGDFNGDGQQDLLQLDTEKGVHQVILSEKNATFKVAGKLSKVVKWGLKNNERLIIRDFNNDGQDDIFALSRDGKLPHVLLYSNGKGGFAKDDGKFIAVSQANLSWAENDAGIAAVTRKSDKQTVLFRAYNSTERLNVSESCLGWVYDTEADKAKEYCPVREQGNGQRAAEVLSAETPLAHDCPIEMSGNNGVKPDCGGNFILPTTPTEPPRMSLGTPQPGVLFNVMLANTGDYSSLTYTLFAQDAQGNNLYLGSVAAPTWDNPKPTVSLKVQINAAGTYQLMYRACHAQGCSGFSPTTSVAVQQPVVTHAVTTSVSAGGTISPQLIIANHGQSVSFTLSAAAGYSANKPSGCGTGNWVNNVYTTAPVTAPCRVEASFSPWPVVATPKTNPPAGTYAGSVLVNLKSDTDGAAIRYTTNGTDVSSSSALYTVPFTLTSTSTVKAKAFMTGKTDSAQAAFSYTITPIPVVATPNANPPAGTYAGSVLVNLKSDTDGAAVRYTTNGTDVSSSSALYSIPFTLTSTSTVKAKAFMTGKTDSAQAAFSYTITPIPVVATPNANPPAGTYAGSVLVNLKSDTDGAAVRYTTNGTDVSSSSALYSVPFTLTSTSTVKAKAFMTGKTDSAQAAFSYTITPMPAPDPATLYDYDARGRLVKAQDHLGESASYALDDAHNRLTVEGKMAPASAPKILSFNAPTTASATNGSVSVSWTSTNTTSCALTVFGQRNVLSDLAKNGSATVTINKSTGIKLTCFHGDNSVSSGRIIRVQ